MPLTQTDLSGTPSSDYSYWFVMLVFTTLIFSCVVLIVDVAQAAGTNESYVIVNYTDAIPGNYGIPLDTVPTIKQEDVVYLNDTIDISLVTGWPGPDGEYRLAYYGTWFAGTSPEDMDPLFILQLPGKARSGKVQTQYKYYIDPAIYEDRPGWWYQFYSNASRIVGNERGGNLRAFYVSAKTRSFTYLNNTTELYIGGNYTPFEPPVEPLMPEKWISDILVARGDAPDLTVAGARAWVFGRVNGLFGLERNITKEDIWTLEPGSYTTVVQEPGRNTIYDVTLDGNHLIPGLYGIKPVDVTAARLDAYVMREKFMAMVSDTDDNLIEYKMELQDPYITLERIDEIYIGGITVMDIRGYTNAANGTEISVTLDEGRSYKAYIAERTKTTEAVRTHPGHLSYYRVYLPIDYDTLTAADARNHTITARTAIGGVVYKDFWISVMPPDSFKPNATIKYIEDRNPFVPIPTPIVQTVEKEVTKVIVEYRNVTIIEKEPFDYSKLITTSVPYIIGSVFALLILIWGAATVWNARTKHKSEINNRRV